MAEDKRSLWSDIKLNILDKGWKADLTKGDDRGYEKKQIKKELQSQEYPFRTRPKKKKKKDIETLNDFQRLLIETSEKVFPIKKKPVKYTKEGLLDVGLLMMNLPTKAYVLDKWTKERESKKFQKKKKYVEGYNEIAQQLIKGTGNFIKSASEWVLMPIDYTFATGFQEKFNKYMDDSLTFAADEPESFMGGVSKLIGEYSDSSRCSFILNNPCVLIIMCRKNYFVILVFLLF